jgi:hypothetical protein
MGQMCSKMLEDGSKKLWRPHADRGLSITALDDVSPRHKLKTCHLKIYFIKHRKQKCSNIKCIFHLKLQTCKLVMSKNALCLKVNSMNGITFFAFSLLYLLKFYLLWIIPLCRRVYVLL